MRRLKMRGFKNLPYLATPSKNNLRGMINESVSLATPFFQSKVPESLSEITFRQFSFKIVEVNITKAR